MVAELLAGERDETRFVKRYLHRDGSTVWADVSSVLRRDERGEPLYFITTVVDITAQRASEQLHRAAEERFAKAFFTSPAGMTITRISDGRFVDANDAFLSMMEYALEEVVGRTSTELGMWSSTERRDVIRRQIATGGLQNRELQVRTRSGRRRDLLFSSQHIVIGDEDHHVTTVIDITERKLAEQAVQRSEEQYRALFENMNAGFVLFEVVDDGAGTPIDLIIKAANRGFAATTGLSIEQVLGRRLHDLLPGLEHDTANWTATFAQVARTGKPSQFERASELLGHHYTINAYKAGPELCAVTFQDITERVKVRAEKAILEQQLQQAQKLESVGRLAGGVAHDFNDMLSVILGYGESVLGSMPQDSPLRVEVAEIVNAGRRSAELTRQLLAFSRKQTMQPTVVDLNAVLIDLERMLNRIIGEDIVLRIELLPTAGLVLVDPGQMQQLVVNLGANARDAMPNGGRLLIEVGDVEFDDDHAAARPDVTPGRHTMLAVTDSGAGIPKEVLDHIFEPFFTTKEKGHGTGLGLATTYGIVKQTGGHIWVYAEPDHGTAFKIYFPVTDRALPTQDPVKLSGQATHGRDEQVLVVEDDASVRGFIGSALPRLGYRVLLAADGDEAVAMVEQGSVDPDLVLTDTVMPRMNGSELVARLRRTLPDLKCLFMSGFTDHSMLSNGVLDPGMPFIHKPFSVAQLAEKIGQSLGRK